MNKFLSLILFFCLPLFVKAQITSGLVAYYPFSGNADDASVNNYNGVISGGVTLTEDTLENSESAYSFDGTSGRIDIMSEIPESLLGTNPKSITLWMYPTKLRNAMVYLGTTASTGGGTLRFITNNQGYLGVDISGGIEISTVQISLNQWNFVFLTWDGSSFTIGKMADDESFESNTISTLTHHNLLQGSGTIGYELLNGFYAGGSLDEVRIYNRELSVADLDEISDLQPLASDAIVHFPFNGNLNDASGNNYHGSVGSGILTPVSDCSGTSTSAYHFNYSHVTFFDSDPNGIPAALLGTNTKSFLLRFYPTQAHNAIMVLGGSSEAKGGSLRLVTNLNGMLGVDISSGIAFSDIPIELNQWNLIYLCWDGTNFTLGNQTESQSVMTTATINTLSYHNLQQGIGYIGMDPYLGNFGNGIFDEVQIYARCLSEQERTAFACQTVTGTGKIVNNLAVVSPNPSSGQFQLSIQTGQSAEMEFIVTNAVGNIIYSEKSASSNNTREINLSAEPGIYFLQIRSGKNVQVEKLVIK